MVPDNNDKMAQFVTLLTACQNRIYAFILSRVPRSADADDLLQDTTGTMWKKFDDFHPGSDFLAWGLEIARYKILNFRKQNKRQNLLLDDDVINQIESLSDNKTKPDQRIDALKICLESLPVDQSSLLRLRYGDGTDVKLIALRLSRSVPWVYKMLTKIHLVLMRCIRQHLKLEDI